VPRLYHWEPNQGSAAALICLHEKGVAFDSEYVDVLAFDQVQPRFLAVNPAGLVPALSDGDVTITETGPLVQYVDEAYAGASLTPAAAYDRWLMRRWLKFAQEDFAPAIAALGWRRHTVGRFDGQAPAALAKVPRPDRRDRWASAIAGEFDEEAEAAGRSKLVREIARMEEQLAQTGWLAGETYSLADIVVFAMVNAVPELLPDTMSARATPHVMAWLERMRTRPAVRKAMAASRTNDPAAAFAIGPEFVRWG
jgi:GST-like protein